MALCLANSLIACGDFVPYDQLVRYKWWYRYGYMSSTGHCFDIGAATKNAIQEFEKRQRKFAKAWNISYEEMDNTLSSELLQAFNVNCSKEGVAGNGALMRLAPVPLFFYRIPEKAVEYSGESGRITHGDDKAYDACRYYGALIVAALHGVLKDELISDKFYEDHKQWFGKKPLHTDILKIAQGSYKKSGGYNEGIRGKGYVVSALEAALWAFWSDNNSFEEGALKAVNLGDDTDTTAAIYGQLAGAVYGYQDLPNKWCKRVYAKNFISHVSNWIVCEGIINDNEEHFAHFGKDDPNEDYDHPEHSVTQNCKSYTFDTDYGHKLRIIDTPGRSSDHPKMSCEEGWSISKKSWDRLLEYTHKSLSPYFIRQECNKVEYFRLKTMGMIRPMLESMRNILRNVSNALKGRILSVDDAWQ
ncbi:unnamed protein product [Rotaria sp. Silwood1]|nr:unnamed protein product [Rotaria sp. Silwood1]CAF1345343.1 unnamed protein product [Rotaria sp. Silwood1]